MADEDIVIVGAGIAGLSTALGLHRLGVRCLVLESSDKLRVTGAAFTTWTNAWKALDVLGIGDVLRRQHHRQLGIVSRSTVAATPQTAELKFSSMRGTGKQHEVRCVKRKTLLETLESELPSQAIRFSSKVVSIQESGHFKLLHLADGSTLQTKVLIGCDGVNSVVGKYLGFKKLSYSGRSATRGYIEYGQNHGFEPEFQQFIGEGVRYGIIPCDSTSIYWFFTFFPSDQDQEREEDPVKMKQFVLGKLGDVPDEIRRVIEETPLEEIICSPLRFRSPWDVLWGNISRDNVCVAGDAFHPMTPDLGQGACSSLEDGIVLARCLGEAFSERNNSSSESREEISQAVEDEEYERIKKGLKKYADKRRWRGFDLICSAYVLGSIQQSDGKVNKMFAITTPTGMIEMPIQKNIINMAHQYKGIKKENKFSSPSLEILQKE